VDAEEEDFHRLVDWSLYRYVRGQKGDVVLTLRRGEGLWREEVESTGPVLAATLQHKLAEYETWGRKLLDTYALPPRRLVPGYRLSESPLRAYSEDEFTVRDYSEGLPGLVWRNFYGPPFVRMFGEHLDALPPECRQRLGEELVLVQPYELPTEAGTEAGTARERELISLLGPECFYDHEHHTLPTRRPVLDALGQPLH
jgi:hypothetical protein